MISKVEVYDASGTRVGADFNKALMWSRSGATLWESQTDAVTPWPWEIEESGVGGFLEYVVSLSHPVTNEVDLSDVDLGEEFTVVHTFYAYSLDTSADAGFFRAAEVFARDPLGGDTGVRFDLAGITPTDNPSVRPVPEPASGMLLLAALAALGLRRRAVGARSFAHVAIAIAALGGTATSARATILLFDQERDPTTQSVVSPTSAGGRLPADYGDGVTGPSMLVPGGIFSYGEGGEGFTPDVTVEIFAAGVTAADSRARLWQNGYGDLVDVVFAEGPGTAGAPLLNVLLRASPGFLVDLYAFDLAGFGSDFTIAGVEVLAGTRSLFAATNVFVEGDAIGLGRTSFEFSTPLSAPELLVVLDFSNLASGIQDNIGLDSVRFGQTPPPVPEPGTAWLMLVGLAALHAYGARK